MNDSIKQLIAGAIIALVGVIAGGTMVVLMSTTIKNEEFKVKNSVPSAIRFQPSVAKGQPSVFSFQPSASGGQRVIPSFQPSAVSGQRMPGVTIPPRATLMKPGDIQKLQELPEVKKAREEFMEAQKRYSEAVKKAMGSGQPSALSFQPSAKASNQVSVSSNPLPVKAK